MVVASRLYPYQNEDVDELIDRPRVILGSVMRAGKMIETFELVRRLDLENVLIVGPKPIVEEWKYKITQWLGDEWLSRFDIYNYEKLRDTHFTRLIQSTQYQLIVLDECHKVKNRQAKQTKGAIDISMSTSRLILASGTPIDKSPADAWTLLHMIDPLKFNSYWSFVEHFCVVVRLPKPPFPKIITGPRKSTQAEFRELLARYMLRREKWELLDHEGRPIILDRAPTRTIPIQLTDEQMYHYSTMEEQMFALIDSGEKITSPNVLAQRLRLRQICLEPNLLSEFSDKRKSSPSAKTLAVLELVEGASDPVVVVTYFERYARILAAELKAAGFKVGEYTGAPDVVPYRHQTVLDFQDGKYEVLVGTIGSIGLGLTLTAGSQIITTDQHYSPQVMDQVISRLEGAGPPRQTKPVEPIDLWAKGTVEDHLHTVLARKTKMFRELVVTEQEVWEETVNEMMKLRRR